MMTDPDDEMAGFTVLVIFCSVGIFVLLWLYFTQIINSFPYFTIVSSSPSSSSSNSSHLNSFLSSLTHSLHLYFPHYDALILTPCLSSSYKLILLLLILLNLCLFLWSDLSIIANIIGTVTIQHITFDLGTIFHFTLDETVQDMWHAHTYLLSILLSLFSGLWPFLKLLTMFFSLLLPTSSLSSLSRSWILSWMDVLGKWSLLDIFFMVILLVAFEFELSLGKDITVILYVEPRWGFYSFLLATILSLILGHASLYLHRLDRDSVTTRGTSASEINGELVGNGVWALDEIGEQEAVMNHIFEITVQNCSCSECGTGKGKGMGPELDSDRETREITSEATEETNKKDNQDRGEGEGEGETRGDIVPRTTIETPSQTLQPVKLLSSTHLSPLPSLLSHHHRYFRVTIFGKITMVVLLLLAYAIIILGCLRTTFSFEFKGLAGYLLQDDALTSYSVLNLGTQLPHASTTPHNSLIRWLQSCYFIYTLLMPLLFLITFLFIWLVSLTLRGQKSALVLVEILLAWSSLDVFVIAMVASVFEISQFAKFMIGDACDDINKILKEYFDDELEGDDVCFDVIASLQSVR
jgi:hypothetical protein